MEQKSALKLNILNRIVTIQQQDFYSIKTLVNLDNINQLKLLNMSTILYDQYDLKLFHIFLYYIINIAYNKQLQNLQIYYVELIRPYYFQHQCQIDIAKYSKICANIITEVHEEYCFYLCYYLVYGRLASNAYIQNQLTNREGIKKDRNFLFNKQKMPTFIRNGEYKCTKSRLNFSRKKKSKKTNHIQQQTILPQRKKTQYEMFAGQLQQIFNNEEQNQLTASNNAKILSQDNQQKSLQKLGKQNKENKVWNGNTADLKHYLSYFPNRVFNSERSAIMESVYPVAHSNRHQVRKLRFNIDYPKYIKSRQENWTDIQPSSVDYSLKKKMKCSIKDRQKRISKRKMFPSQNKISHLNQEFRGRSQELDKIRNKLKHQNKKNGQQRNNFINIESYKNAQTENMDSGIRSEYLKLKKMSSKLYAQSHVNQSSISHSSTRNNLNSSKLDFICKQTYSQIQPSQDSLVQDEKNKKFIKKDEKSAYTKKSQYQQDYEEENEFVDISKKNMKNLRISTQNDNDNEANNRPELLNIDSKERIYHYRTQYRSFMKAHLFNFFSS